MLQTSSMKQSSTPSLIRCSICGVSPNSFKILSNDPVKDKVDLDSTTSEVINSHVNRVNNFCIQASISFMHLWLEFIVFSFSCDPFSISIFYQMILTYIVFPARY